MICPRQECPIERAARAMDDVIREGEKRGAHFNAYMEHHQSCDLCKRCVGWVRVVKQEKDGTRTVHIERARNAA